MSKNTRFISFNPVGQGYRSSLLLLAGLTVGLSLATFSVGASAEDQAAQPARSANFQKRLDRERAAEDQRDRDYAIQEQQRQEEAELRRIRAERAAARNAARDAARQQQQQQQ